MQHKIKLKISENKIQFVFEVRYLGHGYISGLAEL